MFLANLPDKVPSWRLGVQVEFANNYKFTIKLAGSELGTGSTRHTVSLIYSCVHVLFHVLMCAIVYFVFDSCVPRQQLTVSLPLERCTGSNWAGRMT
jgi:hypothetical protein